MSKKELILGIVGLLAVFSILFGLVAVINNYDVISEKIGSSIDGILDSSDTSSTDENNDSTNVPSTDSTDAPSSENNGSSSDTEEIPTFYMTYSSDGKEDIGFSKVGDKYYFFVVAHAPEDMNSGMCFDTWTLNRMTTDTNAASWLFSIDGGVTWKNFTTSTDGEINGVTTTYLWLNETISIDTSVYIVYSVQTNCSDPMSFINTMKNALGDRVSYYYNDEGIQNIDCTGCGGIYTRYENFVWYATHSFDGYEPPDYI